MPSAVNRGGNVGEFHIIWRVVTPVNSHDGLDEKFSDKLQFRIKHKCDGSVRCVCDIT